MTFDRFAFSLALRGLRHNKGQTALTMGAVSISVILIIFLASLIGGLQSSIVAQVTGALPHIELTPPEREPVALWDRAGEDEPLYLGRRTGMERRRDVIDEWSVWLDRIEELEPATVAVSPRAQGQGFISRGEERESVMLMGVDPVRHNRLIDIEADLIEGRFLELGSAEVAIGEDLAGDLGLSMGDKVRVLSAEGITATFTVAGIFDTGFSMVDSNMVFMPLRDGQSILGLGRSITHIGVNIEGIFEAEEIAARLGPQVPFEATSWIEENQQLMTALQTQTLSTNLIMVFTTLAAGFAIASILIMLIVSKYKEVGILKAMGATRGQITGAFSLQGTMMAAMGAVAGAIVGIALASAFGQLEFREDQTLPVTITTTIVLTACLIALAVGFMASIFPARRASKVDPIEVIRGA
ncbi:MAG: ABC transporter permease [Bradymonadaceae bacterium]